MKSIFFVAKCSRSRGLGEGAERAQGGRLGKVAVEVGEEGAEAVALAARWGQLD